MFIAVTICVDYWDLLAMTLPQTLGWATHVYIVTTPEQAFETACDDVTVLAYPHFYHKNAFFNKSGALLFAQNIVHAQHPGAWVALVDADVMVPTVPEETSLNRCALYGAPRVDYESLHDYFQRVNGRPYDILGAGYFQMYWDKSKFYEPHSKDASESDMTFYKKFQSKIQLRMPPIVHLGERDKNWKGRVTDLWG